MSSFRETYQSATIAGKMNYGVDEYVHALIGILVHRVPESVCPSGVAVGLKVQIRSTSDGNHFRYPFFLFDATDGTLCARYESGNGFVFDINTTQVYELPNTTFDNSLQVFGGNMVLQRDLSIYTLNPPITTDEATGTYTADTAAGSLFPVGGYWGGTDATPTAFLWDPINDVFVAQTNSSNQGELKVFRASTGAFLNIYITCAGDVEQVYTMNPPYGYAFSRNSNVTQFNYLTGQVMAVGKLPDLDVARGAAVGGRVWAYDRYNHRILFADDTAQDGDGNDTIVVRGCSPVPRPYAIMPPFVTRSPQVGRKVKIWTRVIGGAGEGIGAVKVTFADQAVGDVAPVEVITDREGWAFAQYDGLATGGAETITVSVEQPDDIFPPANAQGSGGQGWTPNIHLSFNNQTVNGDVSSILTQQVNWSQGTDGYGVYGDITIKRAAKTSSAELRIESGQTGETATATNGTFGGDLVMDTASVNVIPWQNFLWCGVWVYFPTGFNFNTSSDGLRIMQVRDNFTTFTDPNDDIVFELRLKHSGGTTHTGYVLSWPNKTVTETNHNFAAHSSVLLQPDTWHFLQYYCRYTSTVTASEQRLWLDDLLVWELSNTAAQYRDSAGGGALTPFTAAEAIAVSRSVWTKADEVRIFRNWEGGAPSDQTCYVSDVVWTRDTSNRLPTDENGNRYISTAYAENL